MAKTIPTPEIDKMHAVKEQSQAIGEFLEWLQQEKAWELAAYHQHEEACYDDEGDRTCGMRTSEPFIVNYSIERLLAEYFEIDLKKVDDEKRAILESLQPVGAALA